MARWNEIIKCIKPTLEVLAILAVFAGLLVGFVQFQQHKNEVKYMYLAGTWNDIMEVSLDHPEFSDKEKTKNYKEAFTEDKRLKYDIYARLIGGFVENLYYHNYKEEGWDFFEPTVESFIELHGEWFVDHLDYYKETDFNERLQELKVSRINDETMAIPKKNQRDGSASH